jgi:hypothetical protein
MSAVATVVTLSERLNSAADLLEKHGVVAGRRGSISEGFCALGALNAVGIPSSYEAITCGHIARLLDLKPARDRYNFFTGTGGDSNYIVAAWSNNLADAGKGAEVIAGFRRAASLAANEGL